MLVNILLINMLNKHLKNSLKFQARIKGKNEMLVNVLLKEVNLNIFFTY
jgi:hypothetical protein